MPLLIAWSLLGLLGACTPEPPPEPEVPERCKNVHVDRMATDWIVAKGDPKNRARIAESGSGYRMFWVNGGALPMTLDGVKREKDVQFTEVPRGRRKGMFDEGQMAVFRVYAKPHLKKCAVEFIVGRVDKNGKEQVPVKGTEFVQFPGDQSVQFSFDPPEEFLFLGEAAQKPKAANEQIEELGEPRPDHPFGKVPVGLWSDPAADGAADCSYDMDLWFDGQKSPQSPVPAGDVGKNGKRHWFVEWDAPFSGNHTFELHRYRTCGGTRERIAIAAIEAVLT